ncbi:hypothetical protein, partial [Ligilactobacillus acidipiscis]
MSIDNWFNDYVSKNINIKSKKNSDAKTSRDWLINQIKSLSKSENAIDLYSSEEFTLKMGSYARKTQIKPLNDIDQMIIFSAMGSTANLGSDNWNEQYIYVPTAADKLRKLEGDHGLSSIKVIEQLKSLLKDIPQYQNADINRNQQALRLELSSYDWGFDIVPGFRTIENDAGYYYYLIPNGKGNWEKTDPRIDRENLESYQKSSLINLRETIRILKYWREGHNSVSQLNSYMLETMILDFIDSTEKECDSQRVFIEKFLLYLSTEIQNPVYDRKNFQGDLN